MSVSFVVRRRFGFRPAAASPERGGGGTILYKNNEKYRIRNSAAIFYAPEALFCTRPPRNRGKVSRICKAPARRPKEIGRLETHCCFSFDASPVPFAGPHLRSPPSHAADILCRHDLTSIRQIGIHRLAAFPTTRRRFFTLSGPLRPPLTDGGPCLHPSRKTHTGDPQRIARMNRDRNKITSSCRRWSSWQPSQHRPS